MSAKTEAGMRLYSYGFFWILLLAAIFGSVDYGSGPAQACGAAGTSGSTSGTLRMAVTLDDLPFADQDLSFDKQKTGTEALLRVLKAHHVPAIGFVNEDKLLVNGEVDERIGLLRDWLDAGMTLGNHSYGHVGLQKTPLPKDEEAVLKGEVVTRWLMKQYGEAPHYYRYPYNQTGPTKQVKSEFVAFLREHGYAIAPFTIEDDDYVYDRVYSYDISHGNSAEARRIREAYLAHLSVSLNTFETMSRELFGRQIAQIFLIHANRINADTLDTQLAIIEKRGYCYVSLSQALKDPAYDSPDGYVGIYGMSWLHRWAIGLHRNLSVYGQPDPADCIMQRYEAIPAQGKGGAG